MSPVRKCAVGLLLTASIAAMFLPWFGGARGVQEISGTLVLQDPRTLLCLAIAVLGLCTAGKYRVPLFWLGMGGITTLEVAYFLTWHIETVSGASSLSQSFHLAYPEFYVGLGLAAATLIAYGILGPRSAAHRGPC
ncbi:hypothetical protein H8K20_08325 [Neobittarella massiliensis]|uniref:Uncharacterized protein n=1 Tax=Neobittarella massiliensis (ex Bilen et al. 2018) TaxID=2041842 RepID=A0A8J6IKR0_9FIRM|nr:hypothetical protein [Neobittarella massiliensis]MBC3516401.1 hypothetical protein [Neobittarella massiliensis]